MGLRITKIDIKNFRSVRNLSLLPGQMAVLVGKNDAGKSNVLRALNLFFNEKTDPPEQLYFDSDHNVFNRPNRRAKEIGVKLDIELPATYHRTNGEYVVWEKRWRAEGEVYNEYKGYRRNSDIRSTSQAKEVKIPAKSNVHGLLRNINFVYVPAIKDLEYFSELRASIYGIISDVADQEFRNSSQEFEQSIAHQLEDLTARIADSLGLQSRLALPRDMSHIFESLDFLSEGQNISLDARGDGVKARHIPLILKFMADKKRSLLVKGAHAHNFIWGYEEPENSLELSSSMELADQFWNFLDDGISQIILTTHSPVFYNIHCSQAEDDNCISCHHIYMDAKDDGTKEAKRLGELDEHMGTAALLAPMVADIEEKFRRQNQAKAKVEEFAAANRRKLFVEGPSDKDIITKALQVFAPDHADEIDVETQNEGGGGFTYVVDMLSSWRHKAKHHPELPKAAGLVDGDRDAQKAATEWNQPPNNIKSAKCFRLPTPVHIQPIFHASFRIPVVLETLYDAAAWKWANDRGYLQDRAISKVIPDELNNRIIKGDTTLEENLQNEWSIFVEKEFTQEGKGPMARHFAGKQDDLFRERFSFLEQLVNDIVVYLFPKA